MKHLLSFKLFEGKEELSFINPELDYSEFFRLYNYFNNELPKNVDKYLFDKSKYYADMIPKKMNNELQKKYNADNGLKVKDDIDKKWHPFIDFINKEFKKGKQTKVNVDFLKDVYFGEDYKTNKQSFHNFIKDPKFNEKQTGELKDYYKSFDWFESNKNEIPLPVITQLNDKYYLVGGNRRLSWLLSKGEKNIPVWLIK